MEIYALCDICQKNVAKHTCRNCGRKVCDPDFDVKSGFCVSCAKGRRAKK